jgi:hypothetical protein
MSSQVMIQRTAVVAVGSLFKSNYTTNQFSAYMESGSSATVNIYGRVYTGAPARLLGTLAVTTTQDSFKVVDESYYEVWSDVTAINGTVVVVMGTR